MENPELMFRTLYKKEKSRRTNSPRETLLNQVFLYVFIEGLRGEARMLHRQKYNNINNDRSMIEEDFANASVNTRLDKGFKKNWFCPPNSIEPTTTADDKAEEAFEWICSIGSGISGQVVKMRHKASGTICAVKQMIRAGRENNESIYMDLRVLIGCNCDYIVKCYGYFIQETHVWLCTELMTTCFDKILVEQKRPLPEKFLGVIASSILKALEYLKEFHNIVHRDIKPSNILINEQGKVKLCDFGASGRVANSSIKEQERTIICAPYMAPELIHSKVLDVKSDIWSLGMALFELATGKYYFDNRLPVVEIQASIINNEAPRLTNNSSKIYSSEFRNFIEACLTKNVELRPNYKQLLKHPFITKYSEAKVLLSELDGVKSSSIDSYDLCT